MFLEILSDSKNHVDFLVDEISELGHTINNIERAGIVRFLCFKVSLRFPGNEYISKCLASNNHVLMYVVSKNLLHNKEWSLIIKHNIFCLYWILVIDCLSV